MNTDEQFESRLRRQPLRPIPPAWRGESIQAATASQAAAAARRGDAAAALLAGWRLLFARIPLAWAALAALWLGMIGVNLTMPASIVSVTMATPAAARLSALASWNSPLVEFDVVSDSTLPTPKAAPAAPPSDVPLRPRSERRRDAAFGESPPDFSFHLIT